jgi:drug/metabolite transporter (DMT)-like permease
MSAPTAPTAPTGAAAPPAARSAVLPFLAALVTVVLWASAFVGIRAAGGDLSPGPLTLLRLAVGSAVLGALVLLRGEPLPGRALLPGVLVCGTLWFGIYNVALNAGERLVDAGTAAMLVNLGPLLIAGLAGILLREGFPRTLAAGSLVAFSGTVVIAVATSRLGSGSAWGAVLCLAAALAYAGGQWSRSPCWRAPPRSA